MTVDKEENLPRKGGTREGNLAFSLTTTTLTEITQGFLREGSL